MDGAHGALLSIAGGSDLGLFEINEAATLVQEAAHPEANIIFGTIIDDSLGDEVRVTVIAAGFDSGTPTHKKLEPPTVGARGGTASAQAGKVGGSPVRQPAPPRPGNGQRPAPSGAANGTAATPPNGMQRSGLPQASSSRGIGQPAGRGSLPSRAVPVTDADDEVDVPPFMRR